MFSSIISARIIFFNIFESLIYSRSVVISYRRKFVRFRNASWKFFTSASRVASLFAFQSNPRDTFIHIYIRHFEFASSLHSSVYIHLSEATSNYFPTNASLHFIYQIYSVIWTEFNGVSCRNTFNKMCSLNVSSLHSMNRIICPEITRLVSSLHIATGDLLIN